MKSKSSNFLNLAVALSILFCALSMQAEQHRATHLGNPATRFAPPLQTPEDLRSRFRDPKLQPDFGAVLKQWGWKGNLDDLFRAAVTNEISDVKIPVGDTMPFMSTRENGKAICLRNVTWAGTEPISAYAFNFTSNGRRYRCVTPKPCSNFFVEDLGEEAKSGLAIDCSAPEKILAGRVAKVCMTIRNTGNISEPKTIVVLPVPEGSIVTATTDGGVVTNGIVTWEVSNIPPGGGKQVCAVIKKREPGLLSFNPVASSAAVKPVQSSCETKVEGIPAILLEVVDIEDPIEVGKEVNYDIKVTNQGSATGTNIKLICTIPAIQEFVSGKGTTVVSGQDRTITIEILPALAPKAEAIWRVVVKALEAGDVRFKVELSSDQFKSPITEDESTTQY